MEDKKKYSAKEIADIISSSGEFDISTRTVNYYAFDKKLFKLDNTGKNVFTDVEIKKIKGILILKKYTNFTLKQVKDIINQFSLEEIEERFKGINIYENTTDFYQSNTSSYVAKKIHFNNTDDIIKQNKSVERSFLAASSTEDYSNKMKNNNTKITIKINKDITLVVSNDIDSNKLTKIIEIINILN
ncbi:hypothetical protein [Alkaliphilus sp. B6464]|uniref:hypothetical protein n=1 Tax=Alkaliphilus sp. B6464 TaxID=2731219 RepID=UPI001BA8D3EF|nr:hypothetical protein [Alkaliphilus sp. B6464]QUH21910.1 hypothetical protein HYG84_18410 [Alkaliphilus sp. B6464]